MKIKTLNGLLALLAFALAFLFVLSTTSVLAAPTVDNHPGGSILENIQGGTFTLHHRFTYNQAASGFYIISVYWEYVNPNTGLPDNNYNFTLDNFRAYCDNGQIVECTLTNDIDNGSLRSQTFGNNVADPNNYTFNVDIRYSLKGPDGTPHIVVDNHPFHYTNIDIRESDVTTIYPDDVTIKVDAVTRGVSISISPSDNSGANGVTLTYTVTVTNTGNVSDTYDLTVGDNAAPSWSPSILPTSLSVSARGSGNATLSVTIPSNAIGGTLDTIWVQAKSENDAGVFDNKSCLALVKIARGVDVSISPDYQENVRRDNVAFTVTVKNTGNVLDNYALTVSDKENWGPKLDNLFVNIAPGDNRPTILRVTIPDNAVPTTEDNIRVTATSQENENIRDNDTCIVRVAFTRGVRVSISPGENSAFPGESTTFIVTVTNTGDNSDNYVLTKSDSLHWELSLADNLMENLAPGRSRTTRLTVSIPENAAINARDNVTVTVTSRENENVTNNATCIAHSTAITRGVRVSISPAEGEGMPGDKLSYTVAVTNAGNIIDNYDLSVSDNARWSPSISEDTIDVPAGENRTVTLSVTVPDNAASGTRDNITVTATSQENGAITASASCVGRALPLKRVEVRISPGYRSGSPEDTLYFTVYVTNAGQARDSFNLSTSASGGWLSEVEPSSLTLDPDESENVTLSVLIPADAKKGDTGIVEVRAISSSDQSVQGADTCRAIVFAAANPRGGLSIPWLQIIIIAALIVGAVFTVGYLTRRRGRGGRHRAILSK